MNLKKIKKFIKLNWRGILVALAALLFFCGTAGYNYLAHQDGVTKWNSPDENANYIFAKLFAEKETLQVFEEYNLLVDDVIVPRSFRSDEGVIKPVSFLGIIFIYGELANIFGVWILPYLTPFFASIGIIFFYLLLKKVFHRNNALISTLVLSTFPPYIYYTARSMFHNVLFVVLFIVALNYLLAMLKNKDKYRSIMSAILAGLFLGLTVMTRTSELMWLVPVLLFLALVNFSQLKFSRVFLFLVFLLFAILPAILQNKILYGSYLSGGYTEMNNSINTIALNSSDLVVSTVSGSFSRLHKITQTIKDNIFYFGFHPKQSVKMFYYYFVDMFWWIFWPALLGGIILLANFRKMKRQHWIYLGFIFLMSIILIFYYGSWEFHDNPDPNSFTIGNSYTRYWLPVYLSVFPLLSLFIMKTTSFLAKIINKKIKLKKDNKFFSINLRQQLFLGITRALFILLIFFVSLQFVLIGSAEGLVFTLDRHHLNKIELKKILEITEDNSVIVTQYHDKLFFPERKVIVGLFNRDNMIEKYSVLASKIPLYYYNFHFPDKDFNYLNERRLVDYNLEIKLVERVNRDFSLYKLLPRNSED
jgi:hypothetical protein